MQKDFLQYADSMGLESEFHASVERCAQMFRQMTGIAAASILLTPAKDFLGNNCFELWLFSDHAMLNGGILAKSARDKSLEVVVLNYVLSVKLASKHYDMAAYPEVEADERSELTFQCRIRDHEKPLVITASGTNCKHLQEIVIRHFTRNMR